MQVCSEIFQHLGHLSPLALLTSIFISSLLVRTFSALDVIRYSAKSKFFNNSNLFLFTVNLTSASKLEPISFDDRFASIAMLASCFILNNWSHLSFNFLFSHFLEHSQMSAHVYFFHLY